MPRVLGGIFRKRRELLLDLAQCCAEALSEYMRREIGSGTRPGIVVSIATSGDLMQWHPHGHLLVTDGALSDAGAFRPVKAWNADAVMKLFRERLLARLTLRHAISEDLACKLLAWRHPGFSAHIGRANLVRAPLSLKKLVYLDGEKAVLYRSKMNPFLGRNFEAPKKSRCSPSWARLISKVYQVDPLVCTRCGQRMSIVAFVSDSLAIRPILDHLGLIPQQLEKPPPTREVLRVAEHGEGGALTGRMGVSLTSPRQVDHPSERLPSPAVGRSLGTGDGEQYEPQLRGVTPPFAAPVRVRTDPHRAFRAPETPAGVAGCGSKLL
jgi:hypothetical protein